MHSSDRARLRQGLAEGQLLHPQEAHVRGSLDLVRALARWGGVADVPEGPAVRALQREIGEARHVVFVLVDGLGSELVERLPPRSFLRRNLAGELRAVFPSTTASALASLATGAWPARHAVTGWWTHLPEAGLTATILPYVERFGGAPLETLGVPPAVAFPLDPLLPRYGCDARAFLPDAYDDGVFSRWAHGAEQITGYPDLGWAVDAIAARVRGASAPTFSYLYYPSVDAAAHAHGPQAERVRQEALEVDRALERLAGCTRGAARLVVSADHGLIEVPPEAKHTLLEGDPLLELLQVPPGGEPRAPQLHPRPGCEELLARAFRERLGERFLLLDTDEVEAEGLLGPGPLDPITRRRLGSFLALPTGPDVLEYRRQGEGPTPMRGYHAGLTPDEMRIPLVLAGP